MPKLRSTAKGLLLSEPENAAKLKEVIAIYGPKMDYDDIAKYLRSCPNTAKNWARGIPFTGNLRKRLFWTSDVVYHDISEQRYAEVG